MANASGNSLKSLQDSITIIQQMSTDIDAITVEQSDIVQEVNQHIEDINQQVHYLVICRLFVVMKHHTKLLWYPQFKLCSFLNFCTHFFFLNKLLINSTGVNTIIINITMVIPTAR